MSAGTVEYTNCISNEGPEYGTKQSDAGVIGNAKYPFIAITPIPLLPGLVALERVLSMGQTELNCVLMLNWTVWNRTILGVKMKLALNNLQWLICHKTKRNQTI